MNLTLFHYICSLHSCNDDVKKTGHRARWRTGIIVKGKMIVAKSCSSELVVSRVNLLFTLGRGNHAHTFQITKNIKFAQINQKCN